jgi:transcriptional regulator GlxA family with amidase domain
VVYPGLTPLDLVGPLQVLATLAALAPDYRVTTVGPDAGHVDTDLPLRLAPVATFAEVPEPFVVVVPGCGGPALGALGDRRLVEYLRAVDRTAEIVASVSTGSLVLAGAGLLTGRAATTHWAYHRLLERLGARYRDARWVEDGRYLTAAGVSAGIDAALRLVARLADEPTARLVQLAIEYDPQPPHGRIDWSTVDRNVLEPVIAEQLGARRRLRR